MPCRALIAPLLAQQRAATVKCMVGCGLSLGGYTGAGLANAYCDESLARPDRLLVLIASVDDQVVGFLVVLCQPWTFWRGFLGRHPMLALKLGAFALRSTRSVVAACPPLWHCRQQLCWRVLMVAVSADCRRKGYGRDLYEALFRLCEESQLWALVSTDNAPSLALHRGTGWSLPDGGDSTLATRPVRPA